MQFVTAVINDLSQVAPWRTIACLVAVGLLVAGAVVTIIAIRHSNNQESTMPDRTYTPRASPSLVDRILHHPFEIVLAAWWVICGTSLALSLFWPSLPNSAVVTSLPLWLAIPLMVLFVGGGIGILLGLLVEWEANIATGWLLEQIGLTAAGTGWLAYSSAVVTTYPNSLISWSLGVCFTAAAILRFVATLVIESRMRRAIAEGG